MEPAPHLAASIAKWAASQRGRVEVLNTALANQTGEVEFFVDKRASIWSTLRIPENAAKGDYERIVVPVDTLDGLAARHEFTDEVLLKIDTEGADLEVLRGGPELLRRSAAVIIETMFYPTSYGDDAPLFEEIVAEMQGLGFAYRGTIRCCWSEGVCNGADALFVRREVAARLAA